MVWWTRLSMSNLHTRHPWVCCSLAFVLLYVAGCSPKSDRLGVSGAVSLNGALLKSGSIRFTLTQSEKAFSTEADIKEGEYEIPQAKGLPPGTYNIVISAIDENAPMVTIRDASGNPITTAPADLIPPEYGINSEKTVEVAPESENRFVFDIVTS